MKKMKNDNKGFTLVELIVVLVILAILAAILVPALLGYIDEAKASQLELHGKSVYTAAQAVASKMYSKDAIPTKSDKKMDKSTENYKYFVDQVVKISECDTFANTNTDVKVMIKFDKNDKATGATVADKHKDYKVLEVYYTEGGTTWVKLVNGIWEAQTTAFPTAADESCILFDGSGSSSAKIKTGT